MICICTICQKKFGKRKPFESSQETHGSCLDCLKAQLKESGIAEYEQNSTYAKRLIGQIVDIMNGDFIPLEEENESAS